MTHLKISGTELALFNSAQFGKKYMARSGDHVFVRTSGKGIRDASWRPASSVETEEYREFEKSLPTYTSCLSCGHPTQNETRHCMSCR